LGLGSLQIRKRATGLVGLLNDFLNNLFLLGLLVGFLEVDPSYFILLVLANQIVHVGLSLGELHLVHTLAGIPMQESLPPEHGAELFPNALEQLLDRGTVTDERGSRFEASRGNVADAGLDVIGDPLDKLGSVAIVDLQHLLLDFLGTKLSSEDARGSQILSVARIGGSHHVAGIEQLSGQLGNVVGAESSGIARRKRGYADHEEVKTREGDQVDC